MTCNFQRHVIYIVYYYIIYIYNIIKTKYVGILIYISNVEVLCFNYCVVGSYFFFTRENNNILKFQRQKRYGCLGI